jgi:hypothetical protein
MVMQNLTFIKLFEHKQFPNEELLDEVAVLSASYPWCSSFQVLKAIGQQQYDRLEAKPQLNLASIYVGDRSKLYNYTVRKKVLQHMATAEENDRADRSLDRGDVSEMQEAAVNEETSGSDTPDAHKNALLQPHVEGDARLKAEAGKGMHPPQDEVDFVESAGNVSVIDPNPLERQILLEAASSLGALEMNTALDASELPEVNKASAEGKGSQDGTDEVHSGFAKWLMRLEGNVEESQKIEQAGVSQGIIDKFIQDSPQISPAKASFFSPSQMGKLSLVDDESFVTETLAKIYERQGDFKKAARAYKRLSLNYPEKSVYFAALQKKAEVQI